VLLARWQIEITGSGIGNILEHDLPVVTKSVASERILESQRGPNIAGADFGDVLTAVRMHANQTSNPLPLPFVEFITIWPWVMTPE